ncbi:class I SAM-dependent methyltransferase [Candidatus Woesearchaeota archaeon]|nr:class I SAM-dependent methyltransferase [Candidatus Woesearchaeota archaeon]
MAKTHDPDNPEHYFTREPKSRLKTTDVAFSFRNHSLSFLCASGVFSSTEIDPATQLLLEATEIQPNTNILDLGCGIGVIGISIKKAEPTCNVTLSDVNKRALKVSRQNAEKNKVTVDVLESDCYAAFAEKEKKEFDLIITNPPHHAGRELVYKMITEALPHLKRGGFFQLVAKHKKGGKMLQKKMEEVFGNAEIILRGSGLCVYRSKKK